MTDATCWTLIEKAAAGDSTARSEFSGRYLPVVRAYLSARWRNRLSGDEREDAIQDVFVECLREGGVLQRVGTIRDGGFRKYLFGTIRNTASRIEAARGRRLDSPDSQSFRTESIEDSEETLSRVFDRAWAESILREAAERQAARARERGAEHIRRVELLKELFHEERTIAELARMWQVDASFLHHEYARARNEFEQALKEVTAFHHPDSPAAALRECRDLVNLLAG
jgi:RNA polymerase sigma-70 factor (ECF subfamily)